MPHEKHTPYFRVLEALQHERGCALCALERADMHRYFDSLLYEYVNNPQVRAELRTSGGYCPRHAQQLLGFRDGLGIAILYQEQVTIFLQFLEQQLRTLPRLPGSKTVPSWLRHEQCPACGAWADSRRLHLEAFLQGLAEEEMWTALERSSGLCAPHFLAACGKTRNHQLRERLTSVEIEHVRRLVSDLELLIRKSDYRYNQGPSGVEADAWQRAVEFLTGQ